MHKPHHTRETSAQPAPAPPSIPTQAVVTSQQTHHMKKLVSEEDIRGSAYRKWESAGKPTGDGIRFWLEAEQELVQGK
jgi:Protein of unknown function (DUF2934)